ncbi:MAG: hypothetical protein IKL43_03620 [Alistipes sp.]|nr:hypothetical protein [Alistipes sp.]
MKRYFQYIALACLAFALNSCIKDEFVDNSFCRDSQLTLNLSLGDLTRADDEPDPSDDNGVVGDDKISLNENKITRVEIYLYPTGSESSDAKFAYAQDIIANDKVEDLKCTVPAGALSDLFGSSGTSCSAYVVVNYKNETVFDTDNAVKTLTGTSITTLKKRVVETDFTETTTIEVGWVPKKVIDPQDSFVMDSDIATITKTDNALSGTVYVTRAAAKITFTASIPAKLKVDGVEWTPQMEKLTVAFKNLATNSLVDNGSDTSATTDDLNFPADNPAVYAGVSGIQLSYGEDTYADAPGFEGDSDVEGVEDGWLVANIVVPFYTYSNFWTEKANNEPAITLSVPWYVDGKESSTLTTYTYTVPFNIDATTKQGKFVRNKHYQYNLRVGVLGDLVVLGTYEFSYVVLDWIGENTINVELQKPTYLVVEKDYVEMNNETQISVNYSASDDIKAEIVKVVKPVVNTEVPSYPEYKSATEWNALNNKPFSISWRDGVITLKHELDNNRDSQYYDYVPYEIYVKVTMEVGSKTYEEEIKFVQYPAFYIIADTNDDYYYNASGNEDTNKNTYYGGVYVNGNKYGSSSGHSSYGGANYLGAATNKNPNMYVINVSALDSGSGYVIGDPRTRVVDNIPTGDYCPSSAMYRAGTDNTLTFYYPTDDGASTKNMIAPKFRIASSYGVTTDQTYENMQRRCATYQEDGYPAGRWRMPTHAEIDYIVKLSCRGLIPQLFNYAEDDISGDYWCAHGYVLPHNAANGGYAELKEPASTTESHAVRCVYDEWYWSDKCSKTTFTWGDKAR